MLQMQQMMGNPNGAAGNVLRGATLSGAAQAPSFFEQP
jgi:hypothetical protein